MRGSRKQIVWALRIQDNILKTLNTVITNFSPLAATDDIARHNIVYLRDCIDRLIEDDVYAGDIIDLFKDIPFESGDYRQDFEDIMSVYLISCPNTPGQHAILGR